MEDRIKIQLLIEGGFVKKIMETELPPTEYTGVGKSETFQLTHHGEKTYGTMEYALKKVEEEKAEKERYLTELNRHNYLARLL